MNLLNHIGLYPLPKNFTSVEIFRVFLCFSVISTYWVLYHFVSVGCSIGSLVFPALFLLIKRRAASGFWRLCLYCLEQNKIEVVLTGDEFNFSESALVISNHRSINDFIVISYLARLLIENKNFDSILLPRINFLTWATLWRVPTVRLLLNLISYDENWELSQSELQFQLLKLDDFYKEENTKRNREFDVNTTPEWLIMFPEVNIWTFSDSYLQRKQSKKFLLPNFEHVLYPRFTNFAQVIQQLRNSNSNISKVYSVTLLYYESENLENKIIEAPSLIRLFGESPSKITIRVHIKSKTFARFPNKAKKINKWLEVEWGHKEKLLQTIEQNVTTK